VAPIDQIKDFADPVVKLLPPEVGEFLDAGGWWLVLAVAVLLVVVPAGYAFRGVWRALFRGRKKDDWDADAVLDLTEAPLPVGPPGAYRLNVYHVSVRLRLVVMAPLGKHADVDATAVERLLDLVVPGLGNLAREDKPMVRVWPVQLSQQGFLASFHRRTRKREAEGMPSRWVLLAGRAQAGLLPVCLGLGLWADDPNAIGRLNLEPHQWLDLLRFHGQPT
jgi:hypothetical protein